MSQLEQNSKILRQEDIDRLGTLLDTFSKPSELCSRIKTSKEPFGVGKNFLFSFSYF